MRKLAAAFASYSYSFGLSNLFRFRFYFTFLSRRLLVQSYYKISSLEILGVEIPTRPTHRPVRQRDRRDRFQSVVRLAQRQPAVPGFLNLHRDSCCRATLT